MSWALTLRFSSSLHRIRVDAGLRLGHASCCSAARLTKRHVFWVGRTRCQGSLCTGSNAVVSLDFLPRTWGKTRTVSFLGTASMRDGLSVQMVSDYRQRYRLEQIQRLKTWLAALKHMFWTARIWTYMTNTLRSSSPNVCAGTPNLTASTLLLRK